MFGIRAGMYSAFDKNLSKSQLTLSKIDFSPTRQSCKSPRQLSQHELSQMSQGFAVVNVSGLRLELDLAGIEERYPETIFADPAFNKYWDGQEFFLDRHRNSFEVIANWLSIGGELVCPDTIPIDVFLYEISFYQLPVPAIEDFLRNEGLLMEKEEEVKNLTTRMKIWTLFENPTSSTLAKIISSLSILAIVVSTTLFCIETLPGISKTAEDGESCSTSVIAMYSIESICVVWFIIELSLRLLCAPSWRSFIADIMNIIDFLAILPWLFRTILGISTCNGSEAHHNYVVIFMLRILRITRAFRVLKLSRNDSNYSRIAEKWKRLNRLKDIPEG
ncbi:Oidioi.mRNA.OKI2018_I69.PAR.g9651.t1.cds [Oikopleura dioica]|uniref:Oidioi.mRNA.OKI2018_I69.PAR.g9651.t1.cds n=1 Tax=Oikopleura dioica TaxID=34765 RepID=A0ABN7RRY9_OIKDI|nr:Oidioi.mRNA.OKI2018_I69.PAR.g9651.t1.cds [Oikopleura dioica]